MSLKYVAINSNIQGVPCKKKSNQSMNFMPFAPPQIHFSLPKICGSGEKGARHKVSAMTTNIGMLLMAFISIT